MSVVTTSIGCLFFAENMSGKRKVFSLGGRKLGTVGGGERIVKYTTGSATSRGGGADDDLEDIAIVSNADLGEVTYGGGQAPNYTQANGPRLVPGNFLIINLDFIF